MRGAAITALSNEERDQGPTTHVEPLPDQGPAVTMNVQPNEVAQTDQIHEGQIIQKIRNLLKDCQLYEEAQQDALKKNAKEEMKKHISKIEYKYETGNKEWARYLTVAFAYSNSPLTIEEALKLSKVYEVRTLGPGNKIFQCRGDRCNIRNHKNIRGIDNLLDHWEYYCKHQKCTDLGNQQNEREDEEEDEPSMRRHTRGRRNSGQGLPGEGQDTPPNYGGSDTESQETDEDETHPESVTLSDVSIM